FPVLCPGETCKTSIDGKPLFFDGDHISGYGNMFLYDDFKKFIISLLENSTALMVPPVINANLTFDQTDRNSRLVDPVDINEEVSRKWI
ncbi:MAG: hypothetical protein KDJ28_12955, partial [Candidatus Competibacteraceae bacterium]|nr:hypothetical protein [Candidatus Competibacteraceae bacterium]